MIGIQQFKKDPLYLFKNNLLRIGLFFSFNIFLWNWFETTEVQLAIYALPILLLSTAGTLPTAAGLIIGFATHWYQFGFFSLDLFFIAAGLLLTFPVTGLYHSCSHLSLRPRWLNRFFGEITGLWHNSSLDEWSIIHAYHHRYADDNENDPHPPNGQAFFRYISGMGKAIGRSFGKHYLAEHGTGPQQTNDLKRLSRSILVRQITVSLFWFLLLGPQAFVFFYATNIVFKKWHYAWFNWATHVKEGSEVKILNQKNGLYKVVNFLSFNLYYHENHHLRPGLFNPKSLKNSQTETTRVA